MIILGVLQNLLSSARAPGVVVNISLNGALRTRTYTLRAPDFPKVSVSVLVTAWCFYSTLQQLLRLTASCDALAA